MQEGKSSCVLTLLTKSHISYIPQVIQVRNHKCCNLMTFGRLFFLFSRWQRLGDCWLAMRLPWQEDLHLKSVPQFRYAGYLFLSVLHGWICFPVEEILCIKSWGFIFFVSYSLLQFCGCLPCFIWIAEKSHIY